MIDEAKKPSPNAQSESPDEPEEVEPEQFDLPLHSKNARRKWFSLGRIVATPAALDFMERHAITPFALLKRHQSCDWGDVDAEDAATNVRAVALDFRVISSYRCGPEQEPIWVISEADRSVTTLLLPGDY